MTGRFWPFSAPGAAQNCPVSCSANCQEAEIRQLGRLGAVVDPFRHFESRASASGVRVYRSKEPSCVHSCVHGTWSQVRVALGSNYRRRSFRWQKTVHLLEETLDQDDTEVFAIFDHEESAIGGDVITLMAGKIDGVRPIEEFDRC